MKSPLSRLAVFLLAFTTVFSSLLCTDAGRGGGEAEATAYRNLHDSVRYVGMETCRTCHESVYQSFIRTGMGQSFGLATDEKSAADFTAAHVYDPHRDLHYTAYWRNDSLFMQEYRLSGRDTVHGREEYVNYVIGSGQHTNSHLMNSNGYVTQMPMTYYTQQGRWDLPPGFEGGFNTRFARKVGLECMSCHNAHPGMVKGSENRYFNVPRGIDCERCHGPGEVHVIEKREGKLVDVTREIDYSIVNPGKLPADLQFDVCQRCHLQGNAVLKEGKSFFDFRPGMKLSDVMTVFLPRWSDAESDFIMASHADRLKMSRCYVRAAQALTCVTCHNPHVSVKETPGNVFTAACVQCHGGEVHRNDTDRKGDCAGCHMPRSSSSDIPHVSITDHWIRVPRAKEETDGVRKFLSLAPVNEAAPDPLTRARAWLNQYERFGQEFFYLDSAAHYLSGAVTDKNFNDVIRLHYLRGDYDAVLRLAAGTGGKALMEYLRQESWDNDDAWTAYRIAEAATQAGDEDEALPYYERASSLAPMNLEFRNKLGVSWTKSDRQKEAMPLFAGILKEDRRFVPAYANLGYLKLFLEGDTAEAGRLYRAGLALDPDDEALLLNLAGLHIYREDYARARSLLGDFLKKYPGHAPAEGILESLRTYPR